MGQIPTGPAGAAGGDVGRAAECGWRVGGQRRGSAGDAGAHQEAVSKTTMLRYSHDPDSRETEYRTHRPSSAEMVKASMASNKQGQLDPRYERLARCERSRNIDPRSSATSS